MKRSAVFLVLAACGAAVAVPPTILDLQPYRQSESFSTASLVDLNPRVGVWYLLNRDGQSWHLENPDPRHQRLRLTESGLELLRGDEALGCARRNELERARRSSLPYAPLCDGRLYLRNRVAGTQTQIERITDFLRDKVWGGEQIINVVRAGFFQDRFAVSATPAEATAADAPTGAPPPAPLDAGTQAHAVAAESLGLDLGGVEGLRLGRWYAVTGTPGIYLSAVQPRAVDPALPKADRDRVGALDAVEAGALDYLVAFDLSQMELGFVLGTDHPRLDWSSRVPASVRDSKLPGPDGIGHAEPLVTNGMLSPELLPRVAATFTGGFKREHGAFKYGELAQRNHGSHYGFIEQGVMFSRLQPGLATLYVLNDGRLGMKTWADADEALLPEIRHARQNGVALVEYDQAAGRARPGALVTRWGAGNWSGSAEGKLRSLRAGACLIETDAQRFLVYGYFSTATPSAMARVFQAYGCRYAMHLDMNALEHTYLALYARHDGDLLVQHLIEGMAVVDRKGGGQTAPRFLAFPDDRDFFYLVRRQAPP